MNASSAAWGGGGAIDAACNATVTRVCGGAAGDAQRCQSCLYNRSTQGKVRNLCNPPPPLPPACRLLHRAHRDVCVCAPTDGGRRLQRHLTQQDRAGFLRPAAAPLRRLQRHGTPTSQQPQTHPMRCTLSTGMRVFCGWHPTGRPPPACLMSTKRRPHARHRRPAFRKGFGVGVGGGSRRRRRCAERS